MTGRIILMEPVIGDDEGFGSRSGYAPAAKVWAELLRPRIAAAATMGNGAATVITQGIRIRAPSEVKKGWKVRMQGAEFRVLHVDRTTPGEIILTTQEIDTDG